MGLVFIKIQLVTCHVAVCECKDFNADKNKSLGLSSTWYGKIISIFHIAKSSLCIIMLFFQGALIIYPLIFPRNHVPRRAGKFPWQEQINK